MGLFDRWHVAIGLKVEPFSGKRGMAFVLRVHPSDKGLYAAAVEVGKLTRQKLIQSHFDGKDFVALEPVLFWLPMVVRPPEFQLGDFTLDVEQFSALFQGINRTGFRFMTVADSHATGYVFLRQNH